MGCCPDTAQSLASQPVNCASTCFNTLGVQWIMVFSVGETSIYMYYMRSTLDTLDYMLLVKAVDNSCNNKYYEANLWLCMMAESSLDSGGVE
jgi:hypothetical protein